MPSFEDSNIMMRQQSSTYMMLDSNISQVADNITNDDDRHWALQDDEMIRQQEGGLFDLEQNYRSFEMTVQKNQLEIAQIQQQQSEHQQVLPIFN